MNLLEISENNGTYAGIRFSEKTKDDIMRYIDEAGIPNPIEREDLHCTLLYSRKYLSSYDAYGEIDPLIKGQVVNLETWPHNKGEENETTCLVMTFKCKPLEMRQKYLVDNYGATFDYDEYKPHITLSYDVGNLNVNDLPDINDYLGDIEIVEEYSEDLILDWA